MKPRSPQVWDLVAEDDPELALVVIDHFDALLAFAVQLCERFGFASSDADELCGQALILGTDRSRTQPIEQEVIRAWRSTLLSWISAELNDVEPSLKVALLRLCSAEIESLESPCLRLPQSDVPRWLCERSR